MTTDTVAQERRGSGALQVLSDFLLNAVVQVRLLRKAYPGVMHALLFWGVTIQLLGTAVNLMQMQLFIPFVELPFPRGQAYLGYELLMDLAGVAILLGVFMATLRRGLLRPPSLRTTWDDAYALILLALLPLAGFALEGIRLLSLAPLWAHWSPVGNAVAKLLAGAGLSPQAATTIHPLFFWAHVVLGLLFVASIPFTKLRHVVLGPLNILLRSRRKEGTLTFIEDIEETEILGVGQVAEFSPQQLLSFSACVRCGRCEEACPAAASGMPVSPCVLIDSLRMASTNAFFAGNGDKPGELLGTTVAQEAVWACTTCGACLHGCPAFVNPVDEIVDLRRYQVLTTGRAPAAVGSVLRKLEQQGNPWGMPAAERTAWATGLGVRELAPGDETDVLLFLGCAFAFDDRNQQVARAFVRLLQAAEVDFAILGLEEGCCGETARRLGHEYLFQVFAEQNIQTLAQVTFNRIVTQCPHCFNTLRNEYSQLGAEYDVQHYTHFLQEIAPRLQRRRQPEGDAPGRLTYHDPCYLGRYNDTYAEPRQLLDTVVGLRVEMPRYRANSFCCGGGGGQMWLESEAETRINVRRLEEAQSVQADAVATACPYCLLMFDDAIRSQGAADQIRVMDIAELWARQLAPDEGQSSLEEST